MTGRGALVLGLALPVVASAQPPPRPRPTPRPPTFEVGIEVINLNVSVTDARHRYVTGLAEDRATLGSDPSADPGAKTEAGVSQDAPFRKKNQRASGLAQSGKSNQGMFPFLISRSFHRRVVEFWSANSADRTSEHDRDGEVGRAWP